MALKGGEGSASCPGHFLPPGKTQYLLYRRPVWIGAENLAPTRIRSPTVQLVASRYTDWATRPTAKVFPKIILTKVVFFWYKIKCRLGCGRNTSSQNESLHDFICKTWRRHALFVRPDVDMTLFVRPDVDMLYLWDLKSTWLYLWDLTSTCFIRHKCSQVKVTYSHNDHTFKARGVCVCR
jgi:hypothetical protein